MKTCNKCRYSDECELFCYLGGKSWEFQFRLIFGDLKNGGANYSRMAEICKIYEPWQKNRNEKDGE